MVALNLGLAVNADDNQDMNEEQREPVSAVSWRGVCAIMKVAAFFAVPMLLSFLYAASLPDCLLMGGPEEQCTGQHLLSWVLLIVTWVIGVPALLALSIAALVVGAKDVLIPWVREGAKDA